MTTKGHLDKGWVIAILVCFISLALCVRCIHKSEEPSTGPPNIIYIMSDDHAYNAVGAYDSRLATIDPTPVLDRLAAGGILFNNVFCTNSICTPSRASIMTGQYSQTNGVLDLDGRLPKAKQYLPKEMKKLGYQTAMIGKWHLKDAPEAFDYYNVLPGQGRYIDPILYTREKGERVEEYDFSGEKRMVNITEYKGHSSDVITDIALDYLEHKRKQGQPFFLMHHYKAPHDFFKYAPRYESYLANVMVPEPESMYHQPDFGSEALFGKNDELLARIGTSISDRHTYRSYTQEYQTKDIAEDEKHATSLAYQEYLKRYLRCVKGIDDNLKRLFDYLKANDLWDNTVIVYTGDQGMMLGEHDLMDKRWMYEESLRMPFIMSYPNLVKEHRESDLLINNTDFAPTLIELAGGDVPAYMQGKSFATELSEGASEDWREATYYRYWMHLVHHDVPAHFGIRTNKYKLIYYYGEHYNLDKYGDDTMWWLKGDSYKIESTPKAWEFYDLSKDPKEMVNEYGNDAYGNTISDLKEKLLNIRKEISETDEAYPHLDDVIHRYWAQ